MFYWLMKNWVVGPIVKAAFRPWITGHENIPKTGGVILASNHLSFIDSVFLPLVIDRGEGMHVWDDEGNRYLDCFGGVLTVSVGHANPAVNQAIVEQIGKVSHTSTLYVNKPQAALAEKVSEVTPGKLSYSTLNALPTSSSAHARHPGPAAVR